MLSFDLARKGPLFSGQIFSLVKWKEQMRGQRWSFKKKSEVSIGVTMLTMRRQRRESNHSPGFMNVHECKTKVWMPK